MQHRIFKAFFFTFFYDSYDEYDWVPCLALVSKLISGKSIRREAIPRAITTRAIHIGDRDRKVASRVAVSVRREIRGKIQSMATAHELHAPTTAVQMLSTKAVEL